MVQVVSIDEVPNRFGSVSFQSNDVNGAQKSEFLFYKRVNFPQNHIPKYHTLFKMAFRLIPVSATSHNLR